MSGIDIVILVLLALLVSDAVVSGREALHWRCSQRRLNAIIIVFLLRFGAYMAALVILVGLSQDLPI